MPCMPDMPILFIVTLVISLSDELHACRYHFAVCIQAIQKLHALSSSIIICALDYIIIYTPFQPRTPVSVRTSRAPASMRTPAKTPTQPAGTPLQPAVTPLQPQIQSGVKTKTRKGSAPANVRTPAKTPLQPVLQPAGTPLQPQIQRGVKTKTRKGSAPASVRTPAKTPAGTPLQPAGTPLEPQIQRGVKSKKTKTKKSSDADKASRQNKVLPFYDPITGPCIVAKPAGTVKSKRQFREAILGLDKGYSDNVFDATPLKKRRKRVPVSLLD